MPEPEPRARRASDRVPADVKLYVNEGDSETRHVLRGEMAEALVTLQNALSAIRQDVQAGNLQAVTETAQMKATLEELKRDVAHLSGLEPRVASLETYVATANASSAILERNQERGQALRLSWPVWVLMGVNTVLVLLALILH
jgi:hypothetical protein